MTRFWESKGFWRTAFGVWTAGALYLLNTQQEIKLDGIAVVLLNLSIIAISVISPDVVADKVTREPDAG